MDTHLKNLENEVIGYMRTAIAAFDTDHSIVRVNMYKAHDLFGDHLMEWSESFGLLYNDMMRIYEAKTPQPKGHYRTTHIGVGYSSFPATKWIADKEQPPIPTAEELLERFDRLISVYTSPNGASGAR